MIVAMLPSLPFHSRSMRPTPRQILRDTQAEAVLIADPVNIGYLLQQPEIHGRLLVHKGRFHLFTYLPFLHQAEQLREEGVVLHASADLSQKLGSILKLHIDIDEWKVSEYDAFKRKNKKTKIIQEQVIIPGYRRTKDERERHLIRRADRLTASVMMRAEKALKPGIREDWLARQIQIWAQQIGADGMAFAPIVAFGRNTAHPHHEPTRAILKQRDIVQLDVGVKMGGYCADRSDVFFVGDPTDKMIQTWKAVQRAGRLALKAAKAGVSVRTLDGIARDSLKQENLEDAFVHALGHGVGLDVHEVPRIATQAPDEQLQSGEVVAIEPGVYFPGEFGMRWERTLIIE